MGYPFVLLFQENVRLKLCNISWNGFGPEGGAAVGEAMVSNNALLELDVSGNRLTADTAMKMARMISSNDNIRTLRVSELSLGVSGFNSSKCFKFMFNNTIYYQIPFVSEDVDMLFSNISTSILKGFFPQTV